MKRLLYLLAFFFLLQSCSLNPPYNRPSHTSPPNWRFAADNTSTANNFRWWKQFQDPILDALICEALRYNYDIKIAAATVCAFYARLGIAASAQYPQVNGNIVVGRQQTATALVPSLPGQARIYNVYEGLLNFSFDLDLWGQLQSLTENALYTYLSTIEARRSIVLTVVSGVAAGYLLLRQFDEQLKISNDTLKSRIESLRLAKARFEGGQTSLMEVRQAESEVDDAKVQVIQFELQISLQEDLISVLIGANPSPILRGRSLETLPIPPHIPAGLPSFLLCQRPDIIGAEELIIAANARIGAARAQFLPNISLTGLYGTESTSLKSLFTNPAETWNYSLNALQPIFTGGLLISQVELSNAQKCESINSYIKTIITAFQEVSDALISHQKALELAVVQKHNVEVLKDYLRLATIQYNNGETDYLTFLDAERKLFNVELDYATAQGDCLISVVELYKALGGGWVIDADNISQLTPPCKTECRPSPTLIFEHVIY
ncbi:MAG: efflux transporter outer membrane subunit [Chlamydiales bacterium]|nr:efflux transporter outer membrane subunit [Chlamydiales bacterium]